MNKSDKMVYESFRYMSAVFSLSYYLNGVAVIGVASDHKDWLSVSDDIAGWLLEVISDHIHNEGVKIDEKVADLHTAEWADQLTGLAKNTQLLNQGLEDEEVLYFIFCQWFGKVISYFTLWIRNEVEASSFPEERLAELDKLKVTLLSEHPNESQEWVNLKNQIDELAQNWAATTLALDT